MSETDPFDELRRKRVAEAAAALRSNPELAAGLHVVDPAEPRDWPEPMGPEAFVGLGGDFVRLMEPHTEADSGGLLTNFLVASGVLFGNEAYVLTEGKKHP